MRIIFWYNIPPFLSLSNYLPNYLSNFNLKFQILNLCQEKEEIAGKVHAIIDKFAERGLRSIGVAYQV